MQERTDAGKDECRKGRMQDRMDAVPVQDRCRTGLMQNRTAAGQVRCRTGRMQDRSDAR